jgi:hypothetical protein
MIFSYKNASRYGSRLPNIFHKNKVFNGFIGSAPNCLILHKAIKKISENVDLLNDNKYEIDKELYSIVSEHKKICDYYSINNKVKLFNESINELYACVVDENKDVILKHYYKNKLCFLESNQLIPEKDIRSKSKNQIKIGVTFNSPKDVISLYSNGINQNTLYFCEMLINIGYDTYLIVDDNKPQDKSTIEKMLYDSRFKIAFLSDIFTLDFDFCITFGFSLKHVTPSLRHLKTKIIGYFCGNNYIIDSEKVLYNQHKNDMINYDFNDELFDQIWSIPQMVSTNKYYWETIYKCKCVEVPFIWSIKLFEKINSDTSDFLYKKKGDNKKIAIFEPNLSIMKWCLPALFVCENSYRMSKNIDKVYITNTHNKTNNNNDFNITRFNEIIKHLDLIKDRKCSIESRYNTLYFMKTHADIAVSHQWENPLNYLYLDLAWMGWPIVHNAYLCKDIGYYYEDFNYEEGGKVLNEVISNHDENFEEYLKKNRELIDRYLPSNEKLQNEYITLFTNLF